MSESSRMTLPALIACAALAVCTGATAAPLSDVLKRNELTMCALADALPYSRNGGDPEGFQIELGRALAAELGVALRVQFLRLHREPRKGECDVLISVPVPRARDADSDYRLSQPYMTYRPVLVVPQNRAPVEALEAFAPGRVAVQSGSWAHFHLTARNIPVWVRFRSDEEIVRAVETGEAAAGIVSNFGYDWYRSRHPQAPVRAASELPLDEDLGFEVAVGLVDADQALVDRVSSAIARMSAGGVFARVLARYGIVLILPGGGG